MRRTQWGWTLAELLVCCAVLALLMVIAVPAIAYGRSLARDVVCRNQLRRLWIATGSYAGSHCGCLFPNLFPPGRISNVIYRERRPTGWGLLYPRYLKNYHDFFCPSDPGRGPAWEYGWSNWGSDHAEVQCSYGYRGRQGLVPQEEVPLTLSLAERQAGKILGCDFCEPFFAPPRIHHRDHINVLRCNGQVERVDQAASFGPADEDFQKALDTLDR